MTMTISTLTTEHIDAVDALMKDNTRWLGFLPQEALRDYLEKGWVLGALAEDGQLIGYLLYAVNQRRFRITHLCVSDEFRDQGIAKGLVDKLKQTATSQMIITLNCRRDFPAHTMWPQLGFVPIDEKPGRSSAGHLLTTWEYTLAQDPQLSLFQAKISDETLDVIIDAQVFFDLDEPNSDTTNPSQALLADFLIDSLNLWVTDEILVEINRATNQQQRELSRHRAQEFLRKHDPNSFEHFDKALRQLLPHNRDSQVSDIRQLAKAAASDVDIFVTRDQALLNKTKQISELTRLQVLSPTELIIQLHELFNRQSYVPDPVSGLNLGWHRLTSEELADFPYNSFLVQRERKGNFREKLDPFLASPNQYECDLLWLRGKAVALRVTNRADKILSVPFARVASIDDKALFERYLIVDTVSKAVKSNLDMVKFEETYLTPSLKLDLLATGFTSYNDSFVRFCFSRCLERSKVLSAITALCPASINNYQNLSDIELEQHCSPLSLATAEHEQNCFLIPIRPDYAMSLIPSYQSAYHLFGGEINVLLRWDHVYYRSKTRHKMLKPPARILWYVSRIQQVVAISHLDDVVIDTPSALFKKFKKLGILRWKELYQISDGDPSKEIMALKFSHTFPFRNPISLARLRAIFNEDNDKNLVLQGPSSLPMTTFQKLFTHGYPEPS